MIEPQRKLTHEERVELKKLIDTRTREIKKVIKDEGKRKYTYPEYVREWEQIKRATKLAKEGLIILNEKEVFCTHCKKTSNKFSNNRHEDGCPATPIES